MIVWPAKDPNEVLDYTWTVPLDAGDTIDTFTATRIAGTITKASESNTDTIGTIWVSGGAADELAQFSLVAVTDGLRTFREVGILPVVDRAAELLARFRLKYPAFVTVADGPVGYWLALAGREVDATWPSDLILDAKTAWAAHRMIETGVLASPIPGGVTSFKSGDFAATIDSAVAARTGFASTIYGREFLTLRRSAFAGGVPAWTDPDA